MATPREYLDNPNTQTALETLYSNASPTFMKFGNANAREHLIAINQDGTATPESVSDPSQSRHMQTSIPTDAQAIVHSHPESATAVPSPQDYETATKTGKPNFIVSQGKIYVAMPGTDPNTKKHIQVADLSPAKGGKVNIKWK
jgi:hypothetical protein